MTKREMIRQTAKAADVTQEVAESILMAAVNIATNALASGEVVKIHRFGKLVVKQRSAKSVYVYKTGEHKQCPARKNVVFIANEALKEKLNNEQGAAECE